MIPLACVDPAALLDTAFPFHIVASDELRLLRWGPSVAKLLPGIALGQKLEENFRIRRPAIACTYESIRAACHSLFVLDLAGCSVPMRGQVVSGQTGPGEDRSPLLFLCAPWVTAPEEIGRHGIQLNDFAIHNAVSDFMLLLNNHRLAMADMRRLTARLTEQREHLRQANRELENARAALERTTELERLKDEKRYRELFEHSNDLVFTLDPDGTILSLNRTAETVFGCARETTRQLGLSALIGEESHPDLAAALASVQRGETPELKELTANGAGGGRVILEVSAHPVRDGARVSGALVIARDITERKRQQARESQHREILEMIAKDEPLDAILGRIAEGVQTQAPSLSCCISLLQDDVLQIVAAPGLPAAFVRTMDRLAPGPFAATCGAALYWGRNVASGEIATDPLWDGYAAAALEHGLRSSFSVPIVSGAGKPVGVIAAYGRQPRQLDPREAEICELAARAAGLAIEQRLLNDQLFYLAHHDALTLLPNRFLFEDRLQQAIAQTARNGRLTALLYLDLDRFKTVNDTLGHAAGDALLRAFARRVEKLVRRSDTWARIGGDEFALILPEIQSPADASRIAELLLDALREPFDVDGSELFVGASIGIAVFPLHADNFVNLHRNADAAMYRAKQRGRRGYVCFSPDTDEQPPETLLLQSSLHRAEERNELLLEYQPQVDLRSGRTIAVEALVRWAHPSLGLISPARFIPMAEENGLIISIGDWVLEQACTHAARWLRSGAALTKVGVNVSVLQFVRSDFVDTVVATLRKTGLPPEFLDLEITESSVMRNIEESVRQLSKLRALGISISIDDFGTGYSSLSYLQRLPVDTLKIDQAFVREIDESDSLPPLIQAIIALGRGLRLSVLAEGVETTRQLTLLKEAGCDLAQGFLLGKPVPVEEADAIWLTVA